MRRHRVRSSQFAFSTTSESALWAWSALDTTHKEVPDKMPDAWSDKRERQYEHVKESEQKKGRSAKRSKEIAARTVNKQRAQSGETKKH